MAKFINRLTGSIMWVADDRADEYRRLGHKEADTPTEKPTKTENPKKKTRKTTREDKERW